MNFTYDTYRYIFIGAAILCAIMFVVSVVLFFALNIKKVFGDLTGKNAKKAIQKIREENEASGDKHHSSSSVNRDRGKITDKIDEHGNNKARSSELHVGSITTKIATQNLSPETDVLNENNTTVLSEESANTTVLNEVDTNTTVLDQSMGMNETTILSQENIQTSIFQIECDITFIHTNEVIS